MTDLAALIARHRAAREAGEGVLARDPIRKQIIKACKQELDLEGEFSARVILYEEWKQ